jgi:hypothetical protein
MGGRPSLILAALWAFAGPALAQVGSERVTTVFGKGLPGYSVAGSRMLLANYYVSADKWYMSVVSHVAPYNLQYGVTACVPNYYQSGTVEAEVSNASSGTFQATIEYPVGTSIDLDLTCQGSTTCNAPASGQTCTDGQTAPIPIPAGATYNTRVYYVSNGSGIVINNTQGDYGANCVLHCNATDSFTGGTTVSASNNKVNVTGGVGTTYTPDVGPITVFARTGKASAMLIGDSICQNYRNRQDARAAQGLIAPSLQGTGAQPITPFFNACWPSSSAQEWASTGGEHTGAASLYKYFPNFVIELGSIDIHTNGRTLAQEETDLGTIISDIKKARPDAAITLTTWLPENLTSTTGWVTTAGMSADSHLSDVQSYNNAVLNGTIAGNNNGYFDTAGVLSTWSTTGYWKPGPNARTATDCSATATQAKFQSASQLDFQSTDVGFGIYIAGAGTSGGVLEGQVVSSIDSTTQAELKEPGYVAGDIVTTVSGAACGVGGQTWEGIHGTEAAYAQIPLSTAGLNVNSLFHVP